MAFEHPKNSWRGPVTVVWYQGGLKPEPPRGYIDLTDVGNGAIFEGTKGTIFCDFTSRVILPNNDDGDMTYYARRSRDQLLPLIGGTGMPAPEPRPRPSGSRPPRRRREMGPDGFPVVELMEGDIPPALGLPNPGLAAADQPYQSNPRDLFMLDWVDACKGKSDNVKHGTSSKDPLRLRLHRHDDGTDAAGPGGAPRRQEAGVRPGRGARYQRIPKRMTTSSAPTARVGR